MSNFAAKNLNLGQVNALVKKLGGEAVVQGILNGTLKFILEPTEEGQLFDENAFFYRRLGVWAQLNFSRCLDAQNRSTRGAAKLRSRQLLQRESEAMMFGHSGSIQYNETLANAVDLGQVAGKIEAQMNGEAGELLTDGETNIFPVRGKNGALHVLRVYFESTQRGGWCVDCYPFGHGYLWKAGTRVFSN